MKKRLALLLVLVLALAVLPALTVRDGERQNTQSALAAQTGGCGCGQVPSCDPNGDRVVNVGDVVYLISYLYKGGLPPIGDGDCNDDGIVSIGDVVCLIHSLYCH